MLTSIKGQIKKLLVANAEKNYRKTLESQNLDYHKWIALEEETFQSHHVILNFTSKYLTNDFRILSNEEIKKENDAELAKSDSLCKLIEFLADFDPKNDRPQYLVCAPGRLPQVRLELEKGNLDVKGVIVQNYKGYFSDFAFSEIHRAFSENGNLILIYSDEDVAEKDGHRVKPWFKPDWAPEDFLSFLYFGGFVALRAEALLSLPPEECKDLYAMICRLLTEKGAFDRRQGLHGTEAVLHIPMALFHSEKEGYDFVKDRSLKEACREEEVKGLVSVVIPSKDHPDILERCISSLKEKTVLPPDLSYEIIVTDNGSNPENRARIENMLRNDTYLYEEEAFNFSRMCNRGASVAKGDYLLFLNDDMEITEPDWLLKLVSSASLPRAGAVGAKLLYPSSDRIQHAGITNLRIGPAHKLQFLSDSEDRYYGRNRYVHDMMGVTGACLLVRAELFRSIGGFDEVLKVAFNDVDLCYRIYEEGYYNIERNDTFLFHHESLSRGNDAEDESKQLRLTAEKDYLYEKHRALYGKDPFYNPNLTTDMLETEYAPAFHYRVDLNRPWARVSDITSVINNARFDHCVRVGMEAATDLFKWKYGFAKEKSDTPVLKEDLGFYFQGYTFVIGGNNACYERTLLLENRDSGRVYGVEVATIRRPDIAANIPDQVNADLAGYTAKMKWDAVPPGNYRFGMYMKDKTSKTRLYNWSNWTLRVEG